MIKAVQTIVGAIAVISIAVAMPTTALADVKAGVDAWAQGNYDLALREWQGPASAGDPDAQFNLAQAYKLGRGVTRDLRKAEDLYASAAAKGHLQAGENYGLLLFQRGERARAMPYIRTAAERGDPRAQYIYGLALFNGDEVEPDWIKAYAFVSLAQQADLPQAADALAKMDQHIPLSDRQKSVAVAAQLSASANAARTRQVAASDLGVAFGGGQLTSPAFDQADVAHSNPKLANAQRDPLPIRPRSSPALANVSPAGSAPKPAAKVGTAAPTPTANGPWRLQLGAFGVAGNADALWNRVKGRPELTGRRKITAPAGNLTKLMAGGFASQSDANAACSKLKSGGFTCIVARD